MKSIHSKAALLLRVAKKSKIITEVTNSKEPSPS
jgi:hypothetical protein